MKFKCNLKMKNSYMEKNKSCQFRDFLKSDFTKTAEADFGSEHWEGSVGLCLSGANEYISPT